MATESDREDGPHDEPNDDIREILGMLAILVGSRIQRDAEGRVDDDPEASKLLANLHAELRALFVARHKELSKPAYLAMVDALAELYKGAPTKKQQGPAWDDYAERVRSILTEHENIPRAKPDRWTLTAGEVSNGERSPVRHKGGPREAAKAAVADALNIGTGTLVNWRKRDGIESPHPDEQAFFPGTRASFFGNGVDLPHAVADVIEILLLTLSPEVTPAAADLLEELRGTPTYSAASDGLLAAIEDDESGLIVTDATPAPPEPEAGP